ncbi:glyoxalase family protein [Pelagibacterium halotolerans B2]|uniref:Glyoxalase family protein n=1 Tax=Pelagibacterium halotolerans (strain DSM 22347 / JCM 15775 / CGMCC 1.7692 / B2) TaxID=1082931 RepID=G4RED6_PELHB|nr:glyoxalase family protein [Pelagibacterium halotolerans B2]
MILKAADLDAAEAAVRKAGGEITRQQFDFPGGRRFHFREPGGNEMAVWSESEQQT